MTQKERDMAQQLFGGMGAIKDAVLSIAPGLKNVGHDLKEELTYQAGAGAHELAAALFNGSAFVMYPRGGKEDRGVHGPEHDLGHDSQQQEMERGGRSM
jgi:hypothetical protein